VADKMVSDYDEQDKANVPKFLFHLGDVIYNFANRLIITTNSTTRTANTRRRSWRWPAIMTAWWRRA
jgi:hypothetical protein